MWRSIQPSSREATSSRTASVGIGSYRSGINKSTISKVNAIASKVTEPSSVKASSSREPTTKTKPLPMTPPVQPRRFAVLTREG